jgi:hypothetical protein
MCHTSERIRQRQNDPIVNNPDQNFFHPVGYIPPQTVEIAESAILCRSDGVNLSALTSMLMAFRKTAIVSDRTKQYPWPSKSLMILSARVVFSVIFPSIIFFGK